MVKEKGSGLRGLLCGLKEVLLLFRDFKNNNVVCFFSFFDFPAFCEEIRRVFMCVMKGSDDGRVLLDLDLLAFLYLMFPIWLFGSESFGGICLAVFLFQSCLHVHQLVLVCCCPTSACCLARA
jgi:hypothetical protein